MINRFWEKRSIGTDHKMRKNYFLFNKIYIPVAVSRSFDDVWSSLRISIKKKKYNRRSNTLHTMCVNCVINGRNND